MHIRVAGLALPVGIGIGVAVTSCSGAPGTVKPPVSATRSASAAVSDSPAAGPVAPSPAGSVPAGYKRVGGAAEVLQKLHAILVYDAESATAGDPGHFVPNFDAACGPSGTADVGAAGIPVIKAGEAGAN